MKENTKALLGPDHQQFNFQKEDRSVPHITNLNEDEQLSGKLFYTFKSGPITIGNKKGNPKPQIVLTGVKVLPNHAMIEEILPEIREEIIVEEAYEEVVEETKEEIIEETKEEIVSSVIDSLISNTVPKS